MIELYATLLYIQSMVGKPIVCVFNSVENKWYYFIADEFKPANPSSHIHTNSLSGKEISSLLTSVQGFAHGVGSASDEYTIHNKIEELPAFKMEFDDWKWLKLTN